MTNRSGMVALACVAGLLASAGIIAAEPISESKLLQLIEREVDPSIIQELIEKDCVDFEVTADVVIDFSDSLPDSVIEAMLDCREAMEAPAPAVVPLARPLPPRPPVSYDGLEYDNVVVLPFSGPEEFRVPAAERLAKEIGKLDDMSSVAPGALDKRGVEIVADEEEGVVGLDEARWVAASVKAGLAVIGQLVLKRNAGTVEVRTTLELIDVASGENRGTANGRCKLVFAKDKTCVTKAVERAAAELTPTIVEAASQ